MSGIAETGRPETVRIVDLGASNITEAEFEDLKRQFLAESQGSGHSGGRCDWFGPVPCGTCFPALKGDRRPLRADTGDSRSLPCAACDVTTPDASYCCGLPYCDNCIARHECDDQSSPTSTIQETP